MTILLEFHPAKLEKLKLSALDSIPTPCFELTGG